MRPAVLGPIFGCTTHQQATTAPRRLRGSRSRVRSPRGIYSKHPKRRLRTAIRLFRGARAMDPTAKEQVVSVPAAATTAGAPAGGARQAEATALIQKGDFAALS